MTTQDPARSEQSSPVSVDGSLSNATSRFAREVIAASLVSGEMKILMSPEYECVTYVGTRLQLESDGLVPNDVVWPKGIAKTRWTDGDFTFDLARTRPDGFEGPRRGWFDCDNWSLERRWLNAPHYHDRLLRSKTKELKDLLYRETPEWSTEFEQHWKALCAARDDQRFQVFKTLIPGLVPPKRGRKPRPQGDSNA